MKKIIALLFSFVLVLAGCGGSAGSEGDGVLTVWAWDEAYNIDIMNKAAAIFNESNPDVKIEIVDTANADVYQSLHTALASGTTAGLPDIVLIEDMEIPQFLTSYPDAFYDLTNEINYDEFLDYKVNACSYESKKYCMPFDSGVTALWYRTDYIEEAGFTDKDMENLTWSEYFDIAQKVYDKTGKNMLPIQVDDVVYLRMMLQSAGTWYDDANYDSFVDNPVLAEALENTKTIANADWSKNVLDWNEYMAASQSGDVGGIINGMWFMPTIRQAEDQSGLWKMTNTPRLDNNEGVNVSNSGGSSWYVVNKTGDEQLAVDFLNSAYTNKDFYDDILVNNSALGSYLPSYDSEQFEKPDPFFSNQPVNSMLGEWAKEIPSVTYGPEFNSIQNALVGEITAYVNGEIDLPTLLKNASEVVAN